MATYHVDYLLGSANYDGTTLAQPILDEYLILFAGSAAASSGEWEELSINVVPTQKGVLEFYVEVYGSASQYVYVDDFLIS
jgi:hypothetical protein